MTTLKLFFFGPGVGESIVIHLPDGQWGIVDYYAESGALRSKVLEFLEHKNVRRLAFFCLTHPHADHFLGAVHLLRKYKSRIDRIWRYSGVCAREIEAIIAKKALKKAQSSGDTEAARFGNDFIDVITAIRTLGAALPEENYRRVTAGMSLLRTDSFEISALRPSDALNEKIEEVVFSKSADNNQLLLNDEEGPILNALSVALLIRFDSQGSKEPMAKGISKFAAVKVAHHGSSNGLGAAGISQRLGRQSIRWSVITPYNRSHLPRKEMVKKYRAMSKDVTVTNNSRLIRPTTVAPDLHRARLTTSNSGWYCLEVFPTGRVRVCNA
jgi:beta-lactamase superfamily II metal-dependent hydrolase